MLTGLFVQSDVFDSTNIFQISAMINSVSSTRLINHQDDGAYVFIFQFVTCSASFTFTNFLAKSI